MAGGGCWLVPSGAHRRIFVARSIFVCCLPAVRHDSSGTGLGVLSAFSGLRRDSCSIHSDSGESKRWHTVGFKTGCGSILSSCASKCGFSSLIRKWSHSLLSQLLLLWPRRSGGHDTDTPLGWPSLPGLAASTFSLLEDSCCGESETPV